MTQIRNTPETDEAFANRMLRQVVEDAFSRAEAGGADTYAAYALLRDLRRAAEARVLSGEEEGSNV